MQFQFDHNNLNVLDLERSVEFYKKALGLQELRRTEADDHSFTLVFLGDGSTRHRLELTWLRDRKEPYNLGDNEIHLCFTVDDYEACLLYTSPGVVQGHFGEDVPLGGNGLALQLGQRPAEQGGGIQHFPVEVRIHRGAPQTAVSYTHLVERGKPAHTIEKTDLGTFLSGKVPFCRSISGTPCRKRRHAMASLFERGIETLKGVGEKRKKLFEKLGAPTVGDLLRLYPRAYEDWSLHTPIAETPLGLSLIHIFQSAVVVNGGAQVADLPVDAGGAGGLVQPHADGLCHLGGGDAAFKLFHLAFQIDFYHVVTPFCQGSKKRLPQQLSLIHI